MLASAAPFFPDEGVHVAVEDPAWNATRPIVIQRVNGFFVGPDTA